MLYGSNGALSENLGFMVSMRLNMNEKVLIPPYWENVVDGLICLLVGGIYKRYLGIYNPESDLLPKTDFLIGMGVLILLFSTTHYSIHKKFILVRFFWIPVRIIKWDKVSTAEYVYKWHTGRIYGNREGQGIFITLKGCPPFVPELDGLERFLWKHPINSFFIRFTPKQQQRYVRVFQQYYPELSFQLGYEKNFEKGLPYDSMEL